MTTLILVRHGQSVGNVMDVFCGQKEYPLTQRGMLQAQKTADYLKAHYKIDKIYSSDQVRAMQTAEPTAKAFDIEVCSVKALRELKAGIFEGKGHDLVREWYPDLLIAWSMGGKIAPEGGETHAQLSARINAFFDELMQRESGKCIAVFAHWGGIYHILKRICNENPDLGMDLKNVLLYNASICVIRFFDNGRAESVVEFDFDAHLGELSSSTLAGVV